MVYHFGDVILVPFPFTDQLGAKKRPAVVVSSDGYNSHRRDIIIMAITGQIHLPLDLAEAMIVNWRAAGLIKESALKPVFTTLEQSLVIRSLGTLQSDDQLRLREALAAAIG